MARSAVRTEDLVARQGGEEFVLVFPGSSAVDAEIPLERLRERLSESAASSNTPAFTASFGLADSSDGLSLQEILRVADRRLSQAKATGRDRIVSTISPIANDEGAAPAGT